MIDIDNEVYVLSKFNSFDSCNVINNDELSMYDLNDKDDYCLYSENLNKDVVTPLNLSLPENISTESLDNFCGYRFSEAHFSMHQVKTYIADDKQLCVMLDTNEFVNASFVFLNNNRVRFIIKNKRYYKKVLIQGELYLDDAIENKEKCLSNLYSIFNKKL